LKKTINSSVAELPKWMAEPVGGFRFLFGGKTEAGVQFHLAFCRGICYYLKKKMEMIWRRNRQITAVFPP